MKKNFNMKSIIIVICCITIIFLATGFAYLSIKLNGYKNIKEKFDITIVSIEPGTIVKGGQNDPLSSYNTKNNNKTIDFKFKLFAPGDQITYKIKIKNKGTLDGKIITMLKNNDDNNKIMSKSNEQFEIKTSNIDNKKLKVGDTIEYEINISYLSNGLTNGVVEIPLELTLLAEN